MPDKKIKIISDILLNYSYGNYTVSGKVSNVLDQFDIIISGLNLLGEELQDSTVSKNYFYNIFNAVKDMIIITDPEGVIMDFNQTFKTNFETFSNSNINDLNVFKNYSKRNNFFEHIKENIEKDGEFNIQLELELSNQKRITGLFTCNIIYGIENTVMGYLIYIKDVTETVKIEKMYARTVIQTQNEERKRIAKDLHDSFGQELAMIKLILSNIDTEKNLEKSLEQAQFCVETIDKSINRLREICMNLLPQSLINGGLKEAIKEIASSYPKTIKFNFKYADDIPRFNNEIEFMFFKIVQEFATNFIKHAKGDEMTVHFYIDQDFLIIDMFDNGIGMDVKKLNEIIGNRGISNIKSTVNTFNGNFSIKSEKGKGFQMLLSFYLNELI